MTEDRGQMAAEEVGKGNVGFLLGYESSFALRLYLLFFIYVDNHCEKPLRCLLRYASAVQRLLQPCFNVK